MSVYSILLKTLLKQKFRFDKYKSNGKKNRVFIMFLIVGICCLPMLGLIAYSVYNTGLTMKLNGIVTEGYTYLITALQVVVLFTGIAGMLNVIYFSKDTEFLLPLPIKTSSIYAAKLTYVYIDELITGAFTSLLLLVPYAIGVGAPFYAYFQIVLVVLIAPMLPLLLGAVVAIPLMWFIGFFKNKGAITSVVYVLLMGIVFGLYYYFLYKFTGSAAEDSLPGEMMGNLLISIASGAKAILPNYLLATTLNPDSFGQYILNLFLAVLINAALLFLSVGISSLVYRSTVSKQLENPKNKMVVKSEEKRSGVVGALVKSDMRRLFRDSSMGTYTLFQLVIVPVITVFMLYQFTSGSYGEIDTATLSPLFLIAATAFTVFISMSTNTAATTAFTRENRNFYVLKTLPIDFKNILKSKIIIGFLFNEITLVITAVIAAVMTQSAWYYGLSMLAVLTFFNAGTTCLQVTIDLARPRLNWTSFNEGAKNNPSSLMSLLIGFLIMLVVVAVGAAFVYPVFVGETLSAYSLPLMWLVLLAVSAAYMIISYAVTVKRGQTNFDRIEQ